MLTLLHSTTFNGSDTTLGSAGTTTGLGDGNIDLFGNALNIQSGRAINHRGGSDYWQNFGARPTSENVQNELTVFAFVFTTGTDKAVAGVRFNSSTGVAWAARYDAGSLWLFNFTGGGGWTEQLSTLASLTTGTTYYLACGAQSNDGTHCTITAGIYTDAALTHPIATLVLPSTTAGPQSAGQFIFGGWTSGAPGVSFTTYDMGPNAPTAGVATASAVDLASNSLTSTAATAGTSPYTYQWYASQSTPIFTPSSANALAGATSLSVTHGSLKPGQRWYYICRVTDANAQIADTPVCSATTYKRAFRIAMLGDSLTAGNTGDTGPNIGSMIASRLMAADGPNLVTLVNAAVGGTRIEHWTPTASVISGQTTTLWSQLTSAITTAGGVSHCLICIGANNGDVTSPSQYASYLSQIVAGLTALGIRTILDDIPAAAPSSTAAAAQSEARFLSFNAVLDSAVDNLWTFRGANSLHAFTQDHSSNYEDPVHPDATARPDWASVRAAATFRVLAPNARNVSLSTGSFLAA